MNLNEKLSNLSLLNEESLRKDILIPLLSRMGFKSVMHYHGPGERGKDIVCFDLNRLGKREYVAIVAKVTDLDGSVDSPDNLQRVVHQIQQCFDHEYCDLFGMKRVTMDRVWIVTSKRIVSGAEPTIFGTLEKSNLSKLVSFVSGAQLVELLDVHYPEYWDATSLPVQVLRDQKSRLLLFARRLLVSLGGLGREIEDTLNEVMVSETPIKIETPANRTVSHVSPYGVEIDRIAPEHGHEFYSARCGSIKSAFLESKQYVYFSMTEVEELIESYEKVITIEDPVEFVKEFNVQLDTGHSFSRLPFGWVSKASEAVWKLEEGLRDVEPLRQRLGQIGKLGWAAGIVDSIKEIAPEVEAFLGQVDQDEFTLHWQIETIGPSGRLRLLYGQDAGSREDSFTTKHERRIESFVGDDTREITTDDVMDSVRYRVREHFNRLLISHELLEDD